MKVNFRLELAPVDSTDLELLRGWRNDYRIWQWCRQHDVISDMDQKAWYERQAKDPATKMYKLVSLVDGMREAVGVAGLTSIDLVNRRAEFSLYVAPERQGRGYGREGLKLLLAHGFQNLGLNVIWGESFAANPAIPLFESLGMVREGTRQQYYFRSGRFIDAHLFSITRDQWIQSLQPPCSLPPSSRQESSPLQSVPQPSGSAPIDISKAKAKQLKQSRKPPQPPPTPPESA